jgi:hypothetical protein
MPESDPLQTAQWIYSTSCEGGRNYIGETGRPLAVRLREHWHNLKKDLLEKSRLGKHAYEEGHREGWDETRILGIESNSRHTKYKKSAHITCSVNPITQPSFDIYPVWFTLISNEVTTAQRRPV